MSGLWESPLTIVIGGLVLIAILGGGWLQTGHRALLYALLAALVLFAALLVTERLVRTEREQLRDTLHEITRDVESNDLERVLRHVHPANPAVRAEAETEFPRYRFHEVRIKRNLKIDIDMQHQPPKAEAEFNVVVVGSDADGLITDQRVPRFVQVTFYKDGDTWKVYSYRHSPPQEGFLEPREP